MHGKFGAKGLQAGDHGDHRRDADAAGQQKMLFCLLVEGEVIAGVAHVDYPLRMDPVMQRLGTTAAVDLLEHCDQVAVAFRRVVA